MNIIFIRHGKTAGNLEKRYIGRTDENLCREGIEELLNKDYPECEILVSSPMRRCIQTAEIIYTGKKINIYSDLREIDFGDFEGKNYIELNGNPEYQEWVDSKGIKNFPNGEPYKLFKERCCNTFREIAEEYRNYKTIAFVVHGGTVMSIFERYENSGKSFYDYSVPNSGGYITEYNYDGSSIKILENL